MGVFKQQQIDEFDIPISEGNPFTHEELQRFEMEERMQQQDEREMEEELRKYRDILSKELQVVLISLQEDANTRKYSSLLCTDSIARIARLIEIVDGGKLW